MPRPFLITGLPRSRTAWLSMVASTVNDTFCHHEPTSGLRAFEALVQWWNAQRFENVGISDSTLGFQLPRILREIQPRTLVVERPTEDVRRSLLAYLQGIDVSESAIDAYLDDLQRSISACLSHPLVHRISYEDLQDRAELEKALAWIIPGHDLENIDGLMHMNVQVERRYALLKAESPHTHWYRVAA